MICAGDPVPFALQVALGPVSTVGRARAAV